MNLQEQPSYNLNGMAPESYWDSRAHLSGRHGVCILSQLH
jgi:hypothetical protein